MVYLNRALVFAQILSSVMFVHIMLMLTRYASWRMHTVSKKQFLYSFFSVNHILYWRICLADDYHTNFQLYYLSFIRHFNCLHIRNQGNKVACVLPACSLSVRV